MGYLQGEEKGGDRWKLEGEGRGRKEGGRELRGARFCLSRHAAGGTEEEEEDEEVSAGGTGSAR